MIAARIAALQRTKKVQALYRNIPAHCILGPMQTQGFNLLELIIVMVLMALLITIAYPNYQDCLRNAQRQTAKVELSRLNAAMAEYYSQHDSYLGASLNAFGVAAQSNHYQFTIANLAAQHYVISATPFGPQIKDNCKTLSMTETGIQSARTGGCW